MISRTTLYLFVVLASSMATNNVDAAAAAFSTRTGGKVNVNNNPASADVSTGSSSSSSTPKTSTSPKTVLKAQATATPSASASASASATTSFSNLFGAKKSSGAAAAAESLQSSTLSSLKDFSLMLSRANEIATVAMDHAVPLLGDAYTSSFVSKGKGKGKDDEADQYWLNPTIKYEGTTKVPCTNADRAVHALERLFPTYVKYSQAVVLAGSNSNSNSNHKRDNNSKKLEHMNIPQPLAQALARAAAKANQKDVKMDALANAKQIIQEELKLAESEEASRSIDSVHLEILMDTLVPVKNSKNKNANVNSKFQWYTGYLPEVGNVCLQIKTFRPSSQSREQFEKDAKLISSMANFVNAFVKFIPSAPSSVSVVDVDEKKMEMEVNNNNGEKLTKFASPKSLKLLSLDENQAKIQNNLASRSENDSARPIVNLVNDFTDGILEELDAKVLDTTTCTQDALKLELELELNSNTKVRSEVVSHLSTNNMIVSKIITAKPKIKVNEEAAAYTCIEDAAMEKENSVKNDMTMTMQQDRTIVSKRMKLKFPFQSLYFKKVFLAFLVLISRVVSFGQLELNFDE